MKDSDRLERIEKELRELREAVERAGQFVLIPYIPHYQKPYDPPQMWPYWPQPYDPYRITWTVTDSPADWITSNPMDSTSITCSGENYC